MVVGSCSPSAVEGQRTWQETVPVVNACACELVFRIARLPARLVLPENLRTRPAAFEGVMDIPPSLRHLFHGSFAVVDAHQMRHTAWGSPEGVALIDSAGCAAPSHPTGGERPPCHALTLFVRALRSVQPPLSRRAGSQGSARAGASDQGVQDSRLARAPLPHGVR